MKIVFFFKKFLPAGLFFLMVMLWSFAAPSFAQQQNTARIRINDRIYCFEVADTLETKQKGLMFRKQLDKNSGMLFVYPEEKDLYFYMKNTSIPLDIAFIDKDLKIFEIRQMNPFDESIIASGQKAMYALETNRGFFKETGLSVGDKIEFVWKIPRAFE
jgi:uncharacterized membrane protein (UPF0127 family)